MRFKDDSWFSQILLSLSVCENDNDEWVMCEGGAGELAPPIKGTGTFGIVLKFGSGTRPIWSILSRPTIPTILKAYLYRNGTVLVL